MPAITKAERALLKKARKETLAAIIRIADVAGDWNQPGASMQVQQLASAYCTLRDYEG